MRPLDTKINQNWTDKQIACATFAARRVQYMGGNTHAQDFAAQTTKRFLDQGGRDQLSMQAGYEAGMRQFT